MKPVSESIPIDVCCGCSACVSICPTGAVSLSPDQWGYYRRMVDGKLCIQCGLCTGLCPADHLPKNDNNTEPECYEFISSRDDILLRSSSGGIFTVLANLVLDQGGIVVGAAWKDDFSVEHIIVDNKNDLWKLQKSKYLQSFVGTCFQRVKEILITGRPVLFTGTPCQVTGLRAYLGKDYDNLLAVDILCGNAPSAGFFKKYLDSSFPDGISAYEFRHKSSRLRWDSIHVQITKKDGTKLTRSGPREDDYQRVYHNHAMCAPHCENCRYQSLPRIGDISIGDFWWIKKHDPDLDTFKGVSLVLCNNEKGRNWFNSIPEACSRVKKQVPLEWMGGNGHSLKGSKNWCSPHRDEFYDAILKMPFKEAVDYALRSDPKDESLRDQKMYKRIKRLVKKGIICYKDHGMKYTLRRIKIKIDRKLDFVLKR